MATATFSSVTPQNEKEYKRRIWAWTMYDWANSAFATTILAAVLPVYFSQVAGSTLPSPAVATSYWSFGLSISLLIVALLSPILGTISDVMRGKKRFLAIFAGIGIFTTALLVLVDTGDWVLASILGILGRIGFNGANSFYDAMLPHVAHEDDRDRVSARGYAMGYLGGGLLLAVNIVMIFMLPGTWGPRLSFLSVAIWWAVFSIPLFLHVPEPPAAAAKLEEGIGAVSASFKRLAETLRDIQHYRELFKFLLSFLIYNDGIGTIIGVAAIYGAELGFGSVELILALLLVQFVAIPYSLIFGRLPSQEDKRRPFYLAFILFNLIALPLVGTSGVQALPSSLTGTPPPAFTSTPTAAGEGVYTVLDSALIYSGMWNKQIVTAETLGADDGAVYSFSNQPGSQINFTYNGQAVEITYGTGPDHGEWAVLMDGEPLREKSGEPVSVDGYNSTPRYSNTETFTAATAGEHTISLVNRGEKEDESAGTAVSIASIKVLPPARESNLGAILGIILAVELVGLALAWVIGPRLFSSLAEKINAQRSIVLALVIYAVIAIWGFFINSVFEFWFLAWMVAVVQGGSQALSRSLFSAMSPAAKSGEFFGLFGIMEKFSAILGPLIFAFASTMFGSSRPAVLSIIAFFFVGGLLLVRVNVAEGKRVAKEEDKTLFG